MYIKDLHSETVRKYGTDRHDSLLTSPDGKYLTYYNLQCGEGSEYGDYRFCDSEGNVPKEAAEKFDCIEFETDSYFNIGGFDQIFVFGHGHIAITPMILKGIACITLNINKEYHKVGEEIETKEEFYKKAQCTLAFNNKKSIDVLINNLEKLKNAMDEIPKEWKEV